MPDKLPVFTFHLERLYRYMNYKRVSLQICILVFPFAVFKILSFAKMWCCTWKQREKCSAGGGGGGKRASGFFVQLCLWLSGKQENMIPNYKSTE